MEKNEKPKSDLERLKQVHKNWQEFMSKSKIKMKKKMKKDKKDYYDFDYTRGQYYYTYPEYHINFAPPEVQRNFFKDLLQQETKPISDVYLSQQLLRFNIQEELRPQELHDFLKQIRSSLQQQISMLRIQKSLYIHSNLNRQDVVDFMEDQIRSFNCRLIRIHNIYFTFSKSLSQRLEDRTTTLKLKKFDEMHFSQLQKGDFVIYLRMMGVQQRLTFELERLANEMQIGILSKRTQIIKKCYQKRGATILAIVKQESQRYILAKSKIEKHFIQNDPMFFDSEENIKRLQMFLEGLNYSRQMNKPKSFFNVNTSLKEIDYVPSNQEELKNILFRVCQNYFPLTMIQNLYLHKKEHLCYRLNYFASIILRAIVDSYNFIIDIKEKDLHSLRNTMKRQLQTIFTNQADKLFNILEHEIICLVDQQSYAMPQFPYIPSSENQNIFKEYFKVHKMFDPYTQSVINLLSVTNDKTIKQTIDGYISWIAEIAPNKLRYISLFYKNYHSDNKTHIINILNAKLLISGFSNNILQQKFEKILNSNEKMDQGLLRITYFLLAINNAQLRKELQNVLNAEIAIMHKVKFRLKLLEYKNDMPFQMSPQFISRFTQSTHSHDFLSETERKNPKPYPSFDNNDKIFRVPNKGGIQRIEVRRIIPQNPLFEGKRVLYRQAMRECDQLVDKLHKVCAFATEKRENYLHEEKMSGIVDRFQLMNRLLNLQIGYHHQKLKYLEEALIVFEYTINPKGIFDVAKHIYSCKHREVYFSIDQPHFEEAYLNYSQTWIFKATLLSKVRERQMRYEDEQRRAFEENIRKNNHVNNTPEVSSIYYSDQLAMEVEDNIVEEEEDESGSEEISESQFVGTSSKYRSDMSAMSSEYHVKTTFKQILGRNALNALGGDHNKRDQLMGRKRKKILNDSVLGGLLKYADCRFYRYLHKAVDFMERAERTFAELFDCDEGVRREFYEQVCRVAVGSDEESVKEKSLFDENLVSKILADCGKSISKVIEKYKGNPNLIDSYEFFSSPIFKCVLENSTFANLNDLRGLYTCLNIVKLFRNYPAQYLQAQLIQKSAVRELNRLTRLHSGEQLSRQANLFSPESINERMDVSSLLRQLEASTESMNAKHLLFISNNASLTSSVLLLHHLSADYYRQLLRHLYEEVFDYQSFSMNLELLEAYGVYCDENILSVAGLENRLFLRRKIEATHERLARLFKLKNIEEFLSLPATCLALVKKQDRKVVETEAHLLENIQAFESFTAELAAAATLISISAHKFHLKIHEKRLVVSIERILKILPFSNRAVQIKSISTGIYKEMFEENYKGINFIDRGVAGSLILEYHRMTFENISKAISMESLTDLSPFVRALLARRYKEFELGEHALEKYYDYLEVERWEEPYRFSAEHQVKELFESSSEGSKVLNLLVWVECKLLIFGASLPPGELLLFRCLLQNITASSWAFFKDESSKLVSYQEIAKMRVEQVESASVVGRYAGAFLSHENLKAKYRNFLDGLSELTLRNQGREIVNLVYLGNKSIFALCAHPRPDYLTNYCAIRPVLNQTSHFVHFTAARNPNRYLTDPRARPINFDLLKTFIWDSSGVDSFKKEVFFLEDRCEILKQTLNSSNNKMKDITQELSLQLYTRERMKELYEFLNISITVKSKLQYAQFLKKLQQNLLLGIDKLNPTEKYLSKFIEKILKQKPQLVGIKDQILQKIYESRFYEELVLSKLMNISMDTLNGQMRLYNILFESYHQKELIRENKIIKNTLNKVLVPKIILNPYLESPLLLQNYFFAASLKLSYVDSFLNKLKNRAILVELAQGGFGFLLKITELDQCIQSLCKGLITFTEKQFSDRFRTFIESYDQLKQKYRKSRSQGQSLKNIVEVCRQGWGREIKSVIYSKMNSYLGTIHTKQKTYQSVFNIIKSLELQIAKKIDSKYQNRIYALEEQNKKLKEQFMEYQKISARNARSSMEQSKDTLYNSFKREVENILNKEVVKDYAEVGEKQHIDQEQYISTILLKRLRKQKIFYQIKIGSLESKLREKSTEMIKLKEELNKLDNTLTLEQYKNAKFSDQIKDLFQKNIEIEDLKKQIHKKEQEETLNKFKLIKVNEHLQGKISRLEQKNKTQISIIEKESKKEEKNIGIQTALTSQKKQRRNFKIRTQHSQPPIQNQNRVDEVPIWKQKWEMSERKYHILMSKIVQTYEVYRMNRNSIKLIERVGQIFEQCISNQVLRKK